MSFTRRLLIFVVWLKISKIQNRAVRITSAQVHHRPQQSVYGKKTCLFGRLLRLITPSRVVQLDLHAF
jgi:hypothetical protein